MCPSATEADEKNNVPLHLAPAVTTSSAMIEGSHNETNNGSSSSKCVNENDDGSVGQVFDSLSLGHAGTKQLERKSNVVMFDYEDENDSDHRNSSFIINPDKTCSDVGSISEVKAAHNSDTHVDVKSSNFCAEMIMLPVGVCQGSSDFAEQMDIFMRCQHPLDILAMFHDDEVESAAGSDTVNHSFTGGPDGDSQVHRTSGYHAIPRSCEYCGAHDIALCKDDKTCGKPKSYFPREIPPFCSKRELKWKEKKKLEIESNGRIDGVAQKSHRDAKKNDAPASCSAWV